LIPQVADRLKNRIRDKGMGFGNVESAGILDPVVDVLQPWRSWDATGQGLHRVATALGGANVYLQAAATTVSTATTERKPYGMELDPNYQPCICPGGNKDCCFCGGTGWRLR
jgi:hypothetical protein